MNKETEQKILEALARIEDKAAGVVAASQVEYIAMDLAAAELRIAQLESENYRLLKKLEEVFKLYSSSVTEVSDAIRNPK